MFLISSDFTLILWVITIFNINISKVDQLIIDNFVVPLGICFFTHCIHAKRSISPLSSVHYSISQGPFFPRFCPLILPFTFSSGDPPESIYSWDTCRVKGTKIKCIYLSLSIFLCFSCWKRRWWLHWGWEDSRRLARWLKSSARWAAAANRPESSHITNGSKQY